MIYRCVCKNLFHCQGSSVWVPDPESVWVSARLLQDFKPGENQLLLQLPDGNVRHAALCTFSSSCSSLVVTITLHPSRQFSHRG